MVRAGYRPCRLGWLSANYTGGYAGCRGVRQYDLGQLATRRTGCVVALCRRRGDYLWVRFTFLALRGLILEALDCLNRLVFLTLTRWARCTAGFLAAASTNPVAPQLNVRASANVRSRMFLLLRTCGEPQIHFQEANYRHQDAEPTGGAPDVFEHAFPARGAGEVGDAKAGRQTADVRRVVHMEGPDHPERPGASGSRNFQTSLAIVVSVLTP